MSELKTELRRSFLIGSARQAHAVADLTSDSFDVAVLASSWDARSICLTQASELRANTGILVLFDARDRLGLRDYHDAELLKFVRASCNNCELVKGSSCDVKGIWSQLATILDAEVKRIGRPLKILIDLSTCPRYYFLAILAYTLTVRIAHELSFFYSEGIYENGSPEETAFTGGHWSTVSVPLLSGLFDPTLMRHYIVSAGFEGNKTFRAVSRADPDRVSLLLGEPGITKEYADRARVENEIIVEEFSIPEFRIFSAPASDAIATWGVLLSNITDEVRRMNTYFLCCGTKPHALALGLSAFTLRRPAVLYNIPEEHRVHRTRENGVYWLYSIQDLSLIR